nr:PTS sugar transporter subunit IIB [Tissierella sp.]
MINILLVCTAGMSTSMLVKKMEEAAAKKGIEANIWAVGDSDSQEESKRADIVLLGPQVRYLEAKMKERVENRIPVSVIDMMVYGTMNGEKALESALEVKEKFNK